MNGAGWTMQTCRAAEWINAMLQSQTFGSRRSSSFLRTLISEHLLPNCRSAIIGGIWQRPQVNSRLDRSIAIRNLIRSFAFDSHGRNRSGVRGKTMGRPIANARENCGKMTSVRSEYATKTSGSEPNPLNEQ